MSKKISRCLQISKFYPPINGGIETTVRDIAEGLTRQSWSVEILCSHTDRNTVVETGVIPVTRLASWGEVASTSMSPSLVSYLFRRQSEFEIIHVHLPNPMANLALLLTRPSAKVVVHWHSDIVKQKRLLKLYEPLQDWLLRRADAILATSPPYAQSSSWLQPHMNKVHFVPNCIRDPESFVDSAVRQQRAAAIRAKFPGKKLVFALGRMTYYKGFDVLVAAARDLGDDTLVLLGGKGKLLDRLKAQARSLGVDHKVHFLGRIEDEELPGYYEAADVFCLPSLMRSEAFGLVMVEAMSYRKPVVATRIPGSGVTWVNVHGETGLNVEPGDPADLARTLKQLLNDPELAQALGAGGRRRFEHNFTLDKMIGALTQVYSSIGVTGSPP
jgi:glycosyltransferase involved in cell wall biosynthesis